MLMATVTIFEDLSCINFSESYLMNHLEDPSAASWIHVAIMDNAITQI